MKNFLILAVIVLSALASCTKDEPANIEAPQKITFEAPVIGTITKAAPTPIPGEIESNTSENKVYPTAEHFSVYAVYHNETYTSSNSASNYMANVETAYNTELKAWDPQSAVDNGTYADAYYWPKNGYLTFAAYSPSGAVSNNIGWTAANGFVLTGFTVQSDIAKQFDLMFSKRAMNYRSSEKTGDDDNNEYGATTDYAGVQINFEHALSSIVFKAKTEQDYGKIVNVTQTGTIIRIKKITIKNAYSTGNYYQNLADNSNNEYQTGKTATWEEYANETSYEVYNNSASTGTDNVLTNTAVQVHSKTDTEFNDIILLPQSLTHGTGTGAKNVEVELEYSIKTATGNEISQKSVMKLSTEGDNAIDKWEMGKRYTYTIVFGLDKIYFAPEVAEWADVTPATDIKPDYQ